MLTKNELKKLRKEIILNSLFLKDYSNSLFIKEKTAYDFFNSYIEYLYELNDEKLINLWDILDRFDNIKNLWNYYFSFNSDSLCKDDYIAIKSLMYGYGIVIYDINDNYVISAAYETIGAENRFSNEKITRNKIYYDSNGDPYFNKYRQKHYLRDFIKVGDR